jgi:hypothetical protein
MPFGGQELGNQSKSGLRYRFIRDAPFLLHQYATGGHHESTDHDDADGHGAAVLGGFFAGW